MSSRCRTAGNRSIPGTKLESVADAAELAEGVEAVGGSGTAPDGDQGSAEA